MKIFLFGSNGMLGNYVKKYLSQYYTIVSLTREDYDIETVSIHSLNEFLKEKEMNKDDIVINCAGVIPQSQKEKNNRSYFIINSIFPIILSMICKNHNSIMVHITTDCVYNGEKGNYGENDIPNESNTYGLSKSLGDLSDCTIIRTSIIGEEKYNKVSLLEWVISNKGKEINGYTNHFWNGITCLQLSKILHTMIEKNIFWNDVRHIFSPNHVSKYELVNMINDIYQLNIIINKTEVNPIDKTMCSIHEIIFDIPDLESQIKEMNSFKI
jgi:dTDP-4-dehydrorhamnose reductase